MPTKPFLRKPKPPKPPKRAKMGRPSKLTEKQWLEVGERILMGESARSLAKEFGVSHATICGKLSVRQKNLRTIASKIVEVETEFSELELCDRITVRKLADDLRAISMHLADAGKVGAALAKKSFDIAMKQSEKIDENDPMESADVLQSIAALARIANESSTIGMGLLRAGKEIREAEPAEKQAVRSKEHRDAIIDAAIPPA